MSSANIAALGQLGHRIEYSFASGGAVNAFTPIVSEDLQLTERYSYVDRIMNTPQQAGGRFMQESVQGSITFHVAPQTSQQWWRAGIGGASSPYTPARPLESMAIEVDRQAGCIYTSGDMISSMELSSEQGGPLTCAVNIEGKGWIQQAAASASFTSGDDPYLHSEAIFQIDGTTNTNVTAFSVSLDNNLRTDLYANQMQRRVIPATKLNVTGRISLLFEQLAEYNKFVNRGSAPVAIRAFYSRGSRSLEILLNKVRLDSFNAPLGGQSEYIVETFDFTAFVDDPATESAIKVTVV